MADCIAVINAGSSSIKFAIYEATPENTLVFKGAFEGVGVDPRLKIVDAQGARSTIANFPQGRLQS